MNLLDDKNFEFYDETTLSDFDSFNNPEFIVEDTLFFLAIQKRSEVKCLSGKLNSSSKDFFHFITESYEKEKFYIKAIKNLLKQKRYLNLMYEFSHELISADEFNKELEENESQYLIDANESIGSISGFEAFLKVLENLKENLSEEDLTEMFSLEDPLTFKKVELYYHSKKYLGGYKG